MKNILCIAFLDLPLNPHALCFRDPNDNFLAVLTDGCICAVIDGLRRRVWTREITKDKSKEYHLDRTHVARQSHHGAAAADHPAQPSPTATNPKTAETTAVPKSDPALDPNLSTLTASTVAVEPTTSEAPAPSAAIETANAV